VTVFASQEVRQNKEGVLGIRWDAKQWWWATSVFHLSVVSATAARYDTDRKRRRRYHTGGSMKKLTDNLQAKKTSF